MPRRVLLRAMLCLPAMCAAFTKTPIEAVFARARTSTPSSSPPGLGVSELRRALSHAGNDVSPSTARRLVHRYGDTRGRIRLQAFDTLVRTEPAFSESRVLLSVDRHGTTLRPSRQGFARFGRAGMLTSVRMLHYGVGLASLCVGTADMVAFVAAGGMPDMSMDDATWHGMLHTAAAVLSLPRFEYRRDAAPWALGLGSARDANMWPSFLICAWYTAALRTDFAWPMAQADAYFLDPAFLALSQVVAAFIVYGAARGVEEDVRLRDARWPATTASMLMMVPVLLDVGRALYFASSPDMYRALVDTCYPDFTHLQVGMFLGGMYAGNVLCALASAKHHRAVTDEGIANVGIVLNIVYGALPVVACANYVADGRFLGAYLHALSMSAA